MVATLGSEAVLAGFVFSGEMHVQRLQDGALGRQSDHEKQC